MTAAAAIEGAHQALTPAGIDALPAVCPAQPTICAVWDISPATYYRLLAEDNLPVPTFTIGRTRKVYRSEILRALDLPTNDGSAGAGTPTPPVEQSATTSTSQQ